MRRLLIGCVLLTGCTFTIDSRPSSTTLPSISQVPTTMGHAAIERNALASAWSTRTDDQRASICQAVQTQGASWAADVFEKSADTGTFTFDHEAVMAFFSNKCP